MNNVILIGRLTRDPELSYTAQSRACCRMTIAVDRPARQGEEKQADFIRITVWGRQAETCEQFLQKGRQVAIQGRIQTGSYQKDGRTVYTTDVIADRVEFIGSRTNGPQSSNSGGSGAYPQQGSYNDQPRQERRSEPEPVQMSMNQYYQQDVPSGFVETDDEIPF